MASNSSSPVAKPKGAYLGDCRWAAVIAFVIVAAHAAWPYYVSLQQHPDAAMSFLILHRWGGDASYMPLFRFVADLNFRENTLLGAQSASGLMVFQTLSVLPGALMFKLAGAWGLLLTDLIAQCFLFFSYVAILRLALRSAGLRILLALAFKLGATSITPWCARYLPSLSFDGWDPLGMRFPNPIISLTTHFFAMLALWTCFVGGRRRAFIPFCYLMVILAQQNAYYFLQVAAMTLIVIVWRGSWQRLWPMVRSLRWHVLTLTLLILPFLFQMRLGSPGMKERLGLYPISRVTGELLNGLELLPGVIVQTFSAQSAVVFGLCLIYIWLYRNRARHSQARAWRRAGLVAALLLSGHLGQPLLCMVLRMNTHPYHFSEHLQHMNQVSILLLLLPLLGFLPRVVLDSRLAGLAVGTLIVWGGVAVGLEVFPKREHRLQYWGYEGENYDRDFCELINHLEGQGHHRSNATLVTPDLHALHYWTLFGPKHCFSPEPWATTVKSKEVEHRFYGMLKLFGITDPASLEAMLKDRFWLYFISCDRYQASCVRHIGEPKNYDRADRPLLYNGKWWASWQLAVPSGERKRMVKTFSNTQIPRLPASHLVLMVKSEKMIGFSPPSHYETEFENETFLLLKPMLDPAR